MYPHPQPGNVGQLPQRRTSARIAERVQVPRRTSPREDGQPLNNPRQPSLTTGDRIRLRLEPPLSQASSTASDTTYTTDLESLAYTPKWKLSKKLTSLPPTRDRFMEHCRRD